ncbi:MULTISPECIES: hypothetical protein [unclassified Streptomyces]|uniref:hypothetical protein n=1 Tax=unclassified Streptomyces TaxID=2593676 RepID=UPI0006B02137|nr:MULTISPECIES: hypothetical protein [unclassified Streptomyces]KOX28595.1 hypothetical protein ADL06_13410 [Streptomyces sp. NRRL F-6491]KOX41883.1 hypothetical protein ADL08_17480 [Streptomyces sp. NRRL F-6492]
MAPHLVNGIPTRLSMWRRVREYAVPPSMIETATARRAVGDWAGACAAARIDVDLDLRAVADRHGTDLAARLRTDLRRLAPDLLRWHMPRIAPDGRLRPGLTVALARYGGPGAVPPTLVVRTPPAWADAGQRMSLAVWEGPGNHVPGGPSYTHPHPRPERRFRFDLHRHLWDAGRAGELASRCGADGPPSAPPGLLDAPLPEDAPWAVARWAAEAESLLRAEGLRPRGAFTVRLGAGRRAVFELVAPDDSHAPAFGPLREPLPPQEAAALPVLPEAAARTLPDLELLRAGLITAERLHPLVAGALAASVPAAPAVVSGPLHDPGDPHRVECGGEVHRIALRDGVLSAIDHDPVTLRREELLVALGGPALPCLRVIDTVHRSPEALPAVRERLGHGDVSGALAVVVKLLGPGAVLRDGPLREELLSAADRRVDHGLFRAGLATGHPAAGGRAGAAGGGAAPGAGPVETGRRLRIDRRTPLAVRRKRSGPARPRTALSP